MKLRKEKIKEGVKTILKKFCLNLWLLLVLLLVLDLVLGGVFFWKYYLKAEEKEITFSPPLKINQSLVNEFSSLTEEREKLFDRAQNKDYPQLFQPRYLLEEKE